MTQGFELMTFHYESSPIATKPGPFIKLVDFEPQSKVEKITICLRNKMPQWKVALTLIVCDDKL